MKSRLVVYCFLLFLSGCVTFSFTEIFPGESTYTGLTLKTTSTWNQTPPKMMRLSRPDAKSWTRDGLLLDRILIIPAVPDGEPIFRQTTSSQALPVFSSSMLPNEIEELVESSIVKLFGEGGAAVETGGLRPQRFGQNRGIMFDLDVSVSDGPGYGGLTGAMIVEGKLYLVIFLAAKPYYYEKHLDEVREIIQSARIAGDVSSSGTYGLASPVAGEQSTDINGTYVSEITESGSRNVFTNNERKMRITLEQVGNSITGTNSSRSLKINGTREGSAIKFYVTGGNQIDGVWEINADASRLRGKWSTDGGGGASGMWNLTRVGPSPASENQPATYLNFSGTYVSDPIDTNWALRYKSILRIKLNQNLNSVEGEFFKSLNGPVRGSIDGHKVEITWEAGNCNSGEGSLFIDPKESTLRGFLLCRSQGMSKYDVVFRKM